MAINNQASLRLAIADWLNRGDLTDSQIDTFIEIAEARVYEVLRVPTLEAVDGFSVAESDSSVILPTGFNELIELRKEGTGTCSISEHTTRSACSSASGTWTDSDKDDNITLRRVDGQTFHNNRIPNAFTRELGTLLITDDNGERKASGEYLLKYYKSEDAIGTMSSATPPVEQVPWILLVEYEVILFAALAAAQIFLGDFDAENKYNELTNRKISALNEKTKKADLRGGIFTSNFSSNLI